MVLLRCVSNAVPGAAPKLQRSSGRETEVGLYPGCSTWIWPTAGWEKMMMGSRVVGDRTRMERAKPKLTGWRAANCASLRE